MMWTKLVFYLLVCVAFAYSQPWLEVPTGSMVVTLDQGPVRGYMDAHGEFYQFLDVPYATAPTGPNKFKEPLPPPKWAQPFEAETRRIMCPQPLTDPMDVLFTMQEDCLVANIFVPDTKLLNLPVLVNVHGGAYIAGAGFKMQLKSFVRKKKAIVITFNYRLGVHGFLCLGTKDVPGNAGMKDQVTLLRWVKKNIFIFGGDPDNVTIIGCGAGGGSVDFLSLSPMSAGLFKKAIIESGSMFGNTGPQSNPIENAKIYAKKLNFTHVDDIHALEGFYKNASYDFLLSESDFAIAEAHDGSTLFAPCIETETGSERFLSDTPLNILKYEKYHKIPFLYGFSQMEGLNRIKDFEQTKNEIYNSFTDFLPKDLHFESLAQKEEIATKAKEFYFGNRGLGEETSLSYVKYFTDVLFAYPMLRAANLRRVSLSDTLYLYEYSFVDENTPKIPKISIRGNGHCSLFNAIEDEDVRHATEEYKAMKETLRGLWLDFIRTGNPIPDDSYLPSWPAVDGYLTPFMSLNATSQLKQSPLLGDRVRFWDSIYDKYYKAPLPMYGNFLCILSPLRVRDPIY